MENAETLKANITSYIEDKADLLKLKAADKTGSAIAGTITGLVLARLFLFIMIFLSLSAAYAISNGTGRPFLGFLLVAGFYIVLAVLVLVLREKLFTMPVINWLLKKLKYKQHADPESPA